MSERFLSPIRRNFEQKYRVNPYPSSNANPRADPSPGISLNRRGRTTLNSPSKDELKKQLFPTLDEDDDIGDLITDVSKMKLQPIQRNSSPIQTNSRQSIKRKGSPFKVAPSITHKYKQPTDKGDPPAIKMKRVDTQTAIDYPRNTKNSVANPFPKIGGFSKKKNKSKNRKTKKHKKR